MTTFKDIVLKDDQPTEQGMRAMELVYEKLTGECWHRWDTTPNEEGIIDRACIKCGHKVMLWGEAIITPNPDLANSLDAWRPLLNALPHDVFIRVKKRVDARGKLPDEPMELLEDVMREVEVTCHICCGLDSILIEEDRDCTCNNGKITLWEKLEREVK